MIGRAQVMTQAGIREMPVYMDNRDLTNDWLAGLIQHEEEIVYRNIVCKVIGDFVDEDGCKYTELVVVDGTGINFADMNPMGDGFHRVEFTMG